MSYRDQNDFKLLLFSAILDEGYAEEVAKAWKEFNPNIFEENVAIYPEIFRCWFIDNKWFLLADNIIDEDEGNRSEHVITYWLEDLITVEQVESLGIVFSGETTGRDNLDDYDEYAILDGRIYMQGYMYKSIEMEWSCAGACNCLYEFLNDIKETHCANYNIPSEWVKSISVDDK